MRKYIILVFSTFFFLSCSNDPISPQGNSNSGSSLTSNSGDWSIPINEVLDGGPGKDGIPSLTEPNVIIKIPDGVRQLTKSRHLLNNRDLVEIP